MTFKNKEFETIVLQFNDCINKRHLRKLVNLMTDDHIFIDKEGTQIKGKQACEKAWNAFFNLFADYKNIFESIICHDDIVIMQGQSLCSDKRLDGKAIWTAKISNNKISEWRVYNDTPELRQALKL